LREDAKFAGREPIFLDLGGPHVKSREMAAYFLEDRPTVSDWSDDGYFHLPASENTFSLRPTMWVISEADSPAPKSNEQRIGRFAFKSAASLGISLVRVSGGFDEEASGAGSWHWTGHALQYHYKLLGGKPARVRLRFIYLQAGDDKTLEVSITDGTIRAIQQIKMQPAWTSVVTEPFEVNGPDFIVNFECPQPALRISPSDPRMLAFLIKDLVAEVIN
jgi:hypothetical protein